MQRMENKPEAQVDYMNNETDYCAIIKLFERVAEKYPHRHALIYQNEYVTYQALNQKANQLAHFLRLKLNKDAGAIGLCITRSIDTIIGLLAILKSNHIYVPIDPDYPPERQQYIVKDSEASLILVDDMTKRGFPDISSCLIEQRQNAKEIELMPKSNVGVYPDQDALIALYYTSGSTGFPKGVIETHRGFYNRLQWSSKHYTLDTSDTTLQLISIGFSISFFEIMHPLLSGSRLVITTPGTQQASDNIIADIKRHEVTFLHLVPTILKRLVENDHFKDCKSLKKISCGGEILSTELYRALQKILLCELFNAYGSTEISAAITHHVCGSCLQYRNIPIGKPIDNVDIFILDDFMNGVAVGDVGMLYVGGVCLSKGYWNNKLLTDANYINHTFKDGVCKTLYKTGDLVRLLPDGNIMYIGREDQQVKINGCRIELGEIEYHLHKIKKIDEAIVLHNSADATLIAIIVSAHNLDKKAFEEIYDYLKNNLPLYMLPRKYFQVNEILKNINGKIDNNGMLKALQAQNYLNHYQYINLRRNGNG
jgi:amino acid adenylation domain-containing protein